MARAKRRAYLTKILILLILDHRNSLAKMHLLLLRHRKNYQERGAKSTSQPSVDLQQWEGFSKLQKQTVQQTP